MDICVLFMESTLSKRSFQAIYRFLDYFCPIDGNCGDLCGCACCLCSTESGSDTPRAQSDIDADYSMGLYLLPGEEQMFTGEEDWIKWGFLQAEDYDFPDSWSGRVPFFQCTTAPHCPREKRPLQCRTFPLAPHLDEDGLLYMIVHRDPLPYDCPLVRDSLPLREDFIRATWRAWSHLIRDPLIRDMVELDSLIREEEGYPVEIVYPLY